MPKCKDCVYFDTMLSMEQAEGYCSGHEISTQKVSPEKDASTCPISKYTPKNCN